MTSILKKYRKKEENMKENSSAVQVGNDIHVYKTDGSKVVYSNATLLGFTPDSVILMKNSIKYTYYNNGNVAQ